MTPETTHRRSRLAPLLTDVSLEITGKDSERLRELGPLARPGTRVNVTFLAHETPATRIGAARALTDLGMVPVPHLSARRIASHESLTELLADLQGSRSGESVLVVGGDPLLPEGPYPDALSLIESGELERHGVRHVSITGYPEGHPDIATPALWESLREKVSALSARGLDGAITTQFCFDADAVLAWVEELRGTGVGLPVRVGVPGPAGTKRLLAYAKRFGVANSTAAIRRYGLSVTKLMSTAGPDRFVHRLASGYDPDRHGELRLHMYTFGGVAAACEWVHTFRVAHGVE
ncbi:MAG TPA: methylenetetrahydrofolate reductase [Actinomycetes bacterium]|nr:methylenetetrahydrofolate reductase [Actinomycetes bacterium]